MSPILSKEQIFSIIKDDIIKVLPNLTKEDIKIEKSLSDLGANSVDRVEIILFSMENMKLKFSLIELANVKNLSDLVDFFYNKSFRGE